MNALDASASSILFWCDDEFSKPRRAVSAIVAQAILRADCLDFAVGEQIASQWRVIDRDQPVRFQLLHALPELPTIGFGPAGIHSCGSVQIWRVHEKESVLRIVVHEAAL